MPIYPVTKAAAIKATFSTYRPVAGRKVLQLVMEVPIEEQELVFAALGYPVPDESLWVGIARLNLEAAAQDEQTSHHPDPLPLPRPIPLAQIAGIVCSQGAFQKWCGAKSAEEAAEYVRGHCNIASRAELNTNEEAARIFKDIKAEYDAWMVAA